MADAINSSGERPTSILDSVNKLDAQRKAEPQPIVEVLPTQQLSEAERIQVAVDRTQQIGQNLGASEQSVAKVAFQQSVDQGKVLPTRVDTMVSNLRTDVQPVESLMQKITRKAKEIFGQSS